MAAAPNKKSPNPTDRHVGSRIRLRRNIVDMSQERLAQQLGITFQQVQKYEKGTNRVGASRLQAIANILGVPVAFFFEDLSFNEAAPEQASEDTESAAIGDNFLSSTEGLQLNRAFMKITDEKVRRVIIEMVKGIAESFDRIATR